LTISSNKRSKKWCYRCRKSGHIAEDHPDHDPTKLRKPREKSKETEDLYRLPSETKYGPGKMSIYPKLNYNHQQLPETPNLYPWLVTDEYQLNELELETDKYSAVFVLDNGAQVHSSGDLEFFSSIDSNSKRRVSFPNNTSERAFEAIDGAQLSLGNATHCDKLNRNLLSVSLLQRIGFEVVLYTTEVLLLIHLESGI
jgi:hypothetical protein